MVRKHTSSETSWFLKLRGRSRPVAASRPQEPCCARVRRATCLCCRRGVSVHKRQRRFHLHVISRQVLGKAWTVHLQALALHEAAMQQQQQEAPTPAPAASLLHVFVRKVSCMAGPVAHGGLTRPPLHHPLAPTLAPTLAHPKALQ